MLEGRTLLSGSPTLYTIDRTSTSWSGSGNSGDLFYVIDLANHDPNPAGSLILFDPAVFSTPQTISANSSVELYEQPGPMTIEGPGPGLVTVQGNFFIPIGATAGISGLTISGFDAPPQDGGGINNAGTLAVSDCTITNNVAANGGGISNQAGGTLTVTDCTVADNTATADGGGIYNGGSGTMTVTNSTIDGNSAASGGGVDTAGTGLTLTNCTIARNAASVAGGGLSVAGGTALLNNTIIAANSSGGVASSGEISGTVSATSAFNLIGVGGSGGLVDGVHGNRVGVADPGLAPLADYGGASPTIALLYGSPATDAGSNALAVDPSTGQALATDGRGAGFPRIVNNTVDIGAFEFEFGLSITAQPQVVAAASGFDLTVTAVDGSGTPDTSFNGQVAVAMASNPGSATLGGTLTATAQDGVATFRGLTLDKAGDGYSLLVAGTGLSPATTGPMSVVAAPATRLVLIAPPPDGVMVGGALGLAVAAEDNSGNIDPNFQGKVTVSLQSNPDGATLGGGTTGTAQAGVATFPGLWLNEPGEGYTLQVTASPLAPATTAPFRVWAAGVPSIYTVDLTSADGTGSGHAGDLKYVIDLANADANPAGRRIKFDPAVFSTPQTITLTRSLGLTQMVGTEWIDGPGAGRLTIIGSQGMGGLSVDLGVTAVLSNLTLSNSSGLFNSGTLSVAGCTFSNDSAPGEAGPLNGLGGSGGAIGNSGTLTVTASTFVGNSAAGGRGGRYGGGGSGGAIDNSGTLVVTDSTFVGNTAKGGSGHVAVGGSGGAIANSGTLTVTDSTFHGNTAKDGELGSPDPTSGTGGAIDNSGTLTVTGCAFNGDSALVGYANAPSGSGGGINNTGMLTVTNSTFNGESSTGSTGQGGRGGAIANSGTLSIIASTFSGNVADVGGSLYVSKTAKLTAILDAIFQDADGGNISVVQGGAFTSLGHNLFSDTPYVVLDPTDRINADPLLAPLADHGGPTMTMALLPGSPAIDAGVPAAGVTTDQRGIARPQGAAPDIGAFESRGFTVAIASGDGQATPVVSAFPAPLVALVASPYGEPVAGGRIGFAAPTTGASASLTGTPATIGADGRAQVIAVANDLAGSYGVIARAPGTGFVRFALTNQAPPTAPAIPTTPAVPTTPVLAPWVVEVGPAGVRPHPNALALSFSGAMDVARAQDPANYRLVWAGHDHRPGTRDDRAVRIRWARYDPASQSVTLRLSHRLRPRRTFWLTVVGSGPGGLTGADGTPLAAAGGDVVMKLDRRAIRHARRSDRLPDAGPGARELR